MKHNTIFTSRSSDYQGKKNDTKNQGWPNCSFPKRWWNYNSQHPGKKSTLATNLLNSKPRPPAPSVYYLMTRHETHSLEGPMQSMWQKAPHPSHMVMALKLHEHLSDTCSSPPSPCSEKTSTDSEALPVTA